MRTWRAICLGLMAFMAAAAAVAAGGSGTPGDPYVVSTVEELQAIREDLAAHYVLGNDIDASATEHWNGGAGFEPIGSAAEPFTGEIDGRGHAVSELYINRIDSHYVGLFGVATLGATIRRVRVEDARVYGYYDTGILVGRASREALVTLSSATGVLTLKPGSSDAKSGGLIGGVSSGARVDRCFSDVEVYASSRRQVGSLVGYLRGVETAWPIASITDSYAAGTVHGNGWKQGNLLGDADGSRVDRCYSSGRGKALIGFNFRSPTITNSYWDAERGAPSSHRGGTPKTTAQMMQRETFAGWDFDETWGIDEGTSYPYLRFAAPFEMARFDVGSARLVFLGPGRDELELRVLFELAADSDGIEPALEEFTVGVGSYRETLPAGALACSAGVCGYQGPEGGIVRLILGGDFAWVTARGIDLAGTTNPVELSLRIGNDRGKATARLGGTLAEPPPVWRNR